MAKRNSLNQRLNILYNNIFKQSYYRRNVATLLAGNGIGYAILLIAIPIITRLYTPSEYAVLSVFSAFVTFIHPFSSLRFEWLVPNARDESEAKVLTSLALICVAISLSVITPTSIWVSNTFPDNYWIQKIGGYAWLIPLGIFFACTLEILNIWTIRLQDLKPQSLSIIAQNLTGSVIQICGGVTSGGAIWLISGFLSSKAIGSTLLLSKLRAKVSLRSFSTYGSLTELFRQHVKAAVTSSLVSTINNLSVSLPLLLFAFYYGATQTGLIAISLRLGAVIPLVVGRAVSHSFWAEAANLVRENPLKIRTTYFTTTVKLAILSIPAGIICMAAPIYVEPLLGGTEWAKVGMFLMAISPMVVSRITFALHSHLIVHNRQSWQLYWDICRTVGTVVIVVYAAHSNWPALSAVIALAILFTAMNVALFLLNLIAINFSLKADKA